jgi:hypothetical protein
MAKRGRPRMKHPSKWGLWKRAQRGGVRKGRCSRCGATTNLNVHHHGDKSDNSNTSTLCDRCHATVDNPMHKAIKHRVEQT